MAWGEKIDGWRRADGVTDRAGSREGLAPLSPEDLGVGWLFWSVRDAVIVAEADSGRIVLWNPAAAEVFGYPASEALGLDIGALVPERLKARHRAGMARYRDTGGGPYIDSNSQLDLPALRKDGEEIRVEMSLTPVHPDDLEAALGEFAEAVSKPGVHPVAVETRVRHRDGSWRWLEGIANNLLDVPAVGGVVFNHRDVTERKRAERELERRAAELASSNRELEGFAYSVAHDLRAPLRAISGFSELLLEDYMEGLDEEGQDYLRRVRDAGQRMGQLMDGLLDLSHIARVEMHREEVDLSALAAGIAEELGQAHPGRRVEFVAQEGLVAQGDRRLLRLTLEKLMDNAWKFTRAQERATVEFGAADDGGSLIYHVSDDGVGFDVAYAGKLFDPFQRLHPASEFDGVGIGLAMVARIVHRHGGKVWAEGEVGRGATFYFTL